MAAPTLSIEEAKAKGLEARGYKYRLYPTDEQAKQLDRVFDATRLTYNHFLEEIKENWTKYKESGETLPKPTFSQAEISRQLPILKKTQGFEILKEAASVTLQGAVAQLNDAFWRFIKKQGKFPKFKSYRDRQSATFTYVGFNLVDGKLRLARLDSDIEVRWSREMPKDRLTSCTVSRESSGKYYVSFVTYVDVSREHGDNIVTVALGLDPLAVIVTEYGKGVNTSLGFSTIDAPRFYEKKMQRIGYLQNKMSKKVLGSARYEKMRKQLAAIHEHVAAQRKAMQHDITSWIIGQAKAVVIGHPNVQNYLKKSEDDARETADASWYTFVSMLTNKAKEAGIPIVIHEYKDESLDIRNHDAVTRQAMLLVDRNRILVEKALEEGGHKVIKD